MICLWGTVNIHFRGGQGAQTVILKLISPWTLMAWQYEQGE